ncbi:MAG TPA: hypothetical protein VH481_07145 [Nitrososphaeraceae archaeon]
MVMHSDSNNNNIENLLFIIANLPDFLKLSICRTKIKELVGMREAEKKEAIIRSLNSMTMIQPDKLTGLTKIWMRAISEIEPDELTQILYCYLGILESVNLFNKIDPKIILNEFFSLEEDERNKLLVCLKEALFLNPDRETILKSIPTNIAEVIFN